ncbi:MAG: hypothetical protein ABIH03_04775, partial [Pseudomonadota bacterium]
IFISAHEHPKTEQRIKQVGGDWYVTKPIDWERFNLIVRKTLGESVDVPPAKPHAPAADPAADELAGQPRLFFSAPKKE